MKINIASSLKIEQKSRCQFSRENQSDADVVIPEKKIFF